jgi:hypothetical protein
MISTAPPEGRYPQRHVESLAHREIELTFVLDDVETDEMRRCEGDVVVGVLDSEGALHVPESLTPHFMQLCPGLTYRTEVEEDRTEADERRVRTRHRVRIQRAACPVRVLLKHIRLCSTNDAVQDESSVERASVLVVAPE